MVYLLHFDRPFHHARHYLGYTRDLDRRIAEHRSLGRNTHHSLMRALARAGIGFTVARVWEDGDQQLERRLKRMKMGPRLCPICNPNALRRAREPQNGELFA